MKRYTVVATFPSLPAAHAQHCAQADGSRPSVAVSRALDAIFARPAVKGRRVEQFVLRVTCDGPAAARGTGGGGDD